MHQNYPLPSEIWKHYKGGVYRVISLATHTETNEPMVVYQSVPFGSVYVRPLKMWEELVTLENSQVPRFSKHVSQ